MLDTLTDKITREVAAFIGGVAGGIGVITGWIFQIPFLSEFWNSLLAVAPELFTFSSIIGRFVAPGIEGVPAQPFLFGAASFGLVYGAHRAWRALKTLARGTES